MKERELCAYNFVVVCIAYDAVSCMMDDEAGGSIEAGASNIRLCLPLKRPLGAKDPFTQHVARSLLHPSLNVLLDVQSQALSSPIRSSGAAKHCIYIRHP
jgi:hypothetical protein